MAETPREPVRAWGALEDAARDHQRLCDMAKSDAENYGRMADNAADAAEYHSRAVEELVSAAAELRRLAGEPG